MAAGSGRPGTVWPMPARAAASRPDEVFWSARAASGGWVCLGVPGTTLAAALYGDPGAADPDPDPDDPDPGDELDGLDGDGPVLTPWPAWWRAAEDGTVTDVTLSAALTALDPPARRAAVSAHVAATQRFVDHEFSVQLLTGALTADEVGADDLVDRDVDVDTFDFPDRTRGQQLVLASQNHLCPACVVDPDEHEQDLADIIAFMARALHRALLEFPELVGDDCLSSATPSAN